MTAITTDAIFYVDDSFTASHNDALLRANAGAVAAACTVAHASIHWNDLLSSMLSKILRFLLQNPDDCAKLYIIFCINMFVIILRKDSDNNESTFG
jgi:hypothetical protein